MKSSKTKTFRRPLFSKGCYACRTMKVRCDEGKPECARCIRAGRRCPGYRDDSDVVFRSMNAVAAARSDRIEKRSEPSAETRGKGTTPSHRTKMPAPYTPLSMNWEEVALGHFFDSYIHICAGEEPGYLDFLPDLLTKESGATHLKYSLIATSLASLGNIQRLDRLQYRSQKMYGEALKLINAALKDPVEARKDSTLTSVVLLQKYEASISLYDFSKPSF